MSAFEQQLMERLEDYKADLVTAPRLEPLLAETSELTAIFVASVRKFQREA